MDRNVLSPVALSSVVTFLFRQYLKNGFTDSIQICHVDVPGPRGVPFYKVTLNYQLLHNYIEFLFYHTALRACLGTVFTHGVRMGGWKGKGCPGCISETVRYRKLTLGRDTG